MDDIEFTSGMDEQDRITVPPAVAKKTSPDSAIEVRIDFASTKRLGHKIGALDYYMKHGINMHGILPLDRDTLHDRSL